MNRYLCSLFGIYILLIFNDAFINIYCSPAEKIKRAAGAKVHEREIGVTATPLMGDEIDLETMDGVDQLTKLVLLKTDSLPDESDRLDARYLNSLMETLYTGLRKPFKSVSADILGIFPTLDFLNITCDVSKKDNSDQREQPNSSAKNRRSPDDTTTSTAKNSERVTPLQDSETFNNESVLIDNESNLDNNSNNNNNNNNNNYKSSVQVCKAVTNDCLSMNDLVQILPPSIMTSNTMLVRLCPVILFRLISNICPHDNELLSAYHTPSKSANQRHEQNQQDEHPVMTKDHGQANRDQHAATISLNTLQILRKQLQNSDEVSLNNKKRPQKLHKKLKTQTNYNRNGRLDTGSLKQHGVDSEQLLKIRLKLSEPSIEKVWLFSLLFVILSIVVSMGGLIVLPFVKKTTRRRILTLFEGLAVGGLTGSATLHMFPQAFGLVDENYHRYFWRIFVVFLGIYLCYLCERTIKILKVVKAKMRRRSRASLIDMDFRYGFNSFNHHRDAPSKATTAYGASYNYVSSSGTRVLVDQDLSRKVMQQPDLGGQTLKTKNKKRISSSGAAGDDGGATDSGCTHALCLRGKVSLDRKPRINYEHGTLFERKGTTTHHTDKGHERKDGDKKSKKSKSALSKSNEHSTSSHNKKKKADHYRDADHYTNAVSDLESPLELDRSMEPARQRLIRCLKSVRSQFSPVYAVFNQPTNDGHSDTKTTRRSSSRRAQHHDAFHTHRVHSDDIWNHAQRSLPNYSPRRDRLSENTSCGRQKYPYEKKTSQESPKSSITKRQAKHKEIETMLYHRNLIEQQQKCRDTNSPSGLYQQHRFSDVNDLVGERQDQDNPARISVDTVSWMILFGDGLLNVIDGLSIGAAFERNILAGISISVAVMLEEVTHRLGTTAILIRTGMSIKQSFLCTFLSACALFPGMIVGIMLSDATDEATPYIFCAAGGIFLYTGLVDVMKEMNRSIENAMRKDIKTTLKIFALQNVGIILAVIFLSFLALYEPDFEEYQKILNNN